jgi:hypothetical protein
MQDHIRRVIEIVGGINDIANCLARKMIWRAANDPRSRRDTMTSIIAACRIAFFRKRLLEYAA